MPIDRTQYRKGQYMQGAVCPGPQFVAPRRRPLPADLAEFEEAAAVADRLAATTAPSLADIKERIAAAKARLEEIRTFARRQK